MTLLASGIHQSWADSGEVILEIQENFPVLSVDGDKDDEWRFQSSNDLVHWSDRPDLGTRISSGQNPPTVSDQSANGSTFYRSVQTEGLYDPTVLREVNLTFAESNWQNILTSNYSSGTNLAGDMTTGNGASFVQVGIRYKGNTSYSMAGTKKSVNIELDFTDPTEDWMNYETLNLNNAFGDNTIMREPLYFNVMSAYAPSPKGSFARLNINGEYWGVYSFAQQINNELVDEWFPNTDGDRWRAPNIGGGTGGGPGGGGPGGGGGGFASGASAFTYLGSGVRAYSSNYELKTDNSEEAWPRLIHAIDVLNNTPAETFRDAVEDVFAVDSWLWFLAVENIFTDDDSYWNKGADYAFYYEVESGRIFPIEHDGNEAFTTNDVTLSPLEGEGNPNRPMIANLLAIDEFKQRYLAHMRTVLEEKYNSEVMNPLIDQYQVLIQKAIEEDTKKSFSSRQFELAISSLKSHIQQRHDYLLSHTALTPVPPTIVDVSTPGSPIAGQTATITATIEPHESEGIDSVWLYHRGGSTGKFTYTEMFDDGAHGDSAAGDHIYGAETAGYLAGVRVRYYVEARSGNAAKAAVFSPARAERDTYTYRVAAGAPGESAIVINEFMASNDAAFADEAGQFDDWIELHNVSGVDVDLTGMYLSDNANNPCKWAIPEGTSIPAGGYLIVWADEDGDTATEGLHANFRLAAGGEEILLVDTDEKLNALLDHIEFGEQQSDVSYGRTPADASSFAFMQPTPGAANQ